MSILTPRIDKLDKNYIINGAFDFWQRAILTGQATERSSYNSADRFVLNTFNTAGTRQMERITDTPNSRTKYSGQASFDTTGSSSLEIRHRIESVFARDLVGEEISFSGHFNSDEFQEVKIEVFTADAEDNFGAVTSIYSEVFSLTANSTWQQIIKEKLATVSANGSNGVEVVATFQNPTVGSGNHFAKFSQFKLNVGPVQEFSLAGRNIGEELSLCQRYFEKSYRLDTAAGAATGLGAWRYAHWDSNLQGDFRYPRIEFRTMKRTALSTITTYSELGTVGRASRFGPGTDLGAGSADPLASGNTEYSFNSRNTGAAETLDANLRMLRFQWTADAEL